MGGGIFIALWALGLGGPTFQAGTWWYVTVPRQDRTVRVPHIGD